MTFDVWNRVLCHHGVKGQQWGVRRGPPYPLEDTTLHKGHKVNTVSYYKSSEKLAKNLQKRNRWLYTYNPNDDWDSKVYKGPFARYKTEDSKALVAEHQFELVKDLKMPTSKERVDAFIELYSKNKKQTAKELEAHAKLLKKLDIDPDAWKGFNAQNLTSTSELKRAYRLFNNMMENIARYKSTQAYAKLMASKFDAMVDDNNQGVYNNAHDPVIIFRANEVLKAIGDVHIIDRDEIAANLAYVENELAKKGKHVVT